MSHIWVTYTRQLSDWNLNFFTRKLYADLTLVSSETADRWWRHRVREKLPYLPYGSMSNDDSRGLESLDRSHVSLSTARAATDGGKPNNPIRDRLESITQLTRTLLADVRNPDDHDVLEDVDEPACRDAKRRLREINAEAGRVGLLLCGPEVELPYGAADKSDDDLPTIVRSDSFTTSYLGPAPGAFERVQDAADRDRTEDHDHEDDSHESADLPHDTNDTTDADTGGDRDGE